MIHFEWNENKNKSNIQKHNVSFEEAQSSFYDEKALLIDDPDHSNEEERFILMGMSSKLRILVIVHCYREDDQCIRIISARRATKQEKNQYFGKKT